MKYLKMIACFIMGHEWTSANKEGKKPTPEQLAKGIEGFKEYSKMYCGRCGKESELNDW